MSEEYANKVEAYANWISERECSDMGVAEIDAVTSLVEMYKDERGVYDWQGIEPLLHDIVMYGAAMGVAGFIYHADLEKFFKSHVRAVMSVMTDLDMTIETGYEYETAIWVILQNAAESLFNALS